MNSSDFLTQAEVAEILSCHPITISRYADEGLLPYYKFGKRKRFRKEDIDNFIKGARRGSANAENTSNID